MRFKKTDKNTSEKVDKPSKKAGKSAKNLSGKTVIGLDISPTHVRMVQISGRSLNQIQVEKYAIEALPQNVVTGTEIANFDTLVSHLQQCYTKMKTNCKLVNIAMPAGVVTIEDNLPYAEGGDLSVQEFVESEVSRVGALDDMNYDWNELASLPGQREKTILMVAAREDSVNQYKDLVEEINLTAINIDVDILALFNSFAYVNEMHNNEYFYERIALFEVGDVNMKALIIESGRILYRHETAFGLDQLVQLIQRSYQTTDSEALEMIHGKRQRPADYQATVVDYFNVQVAQEVQRAMQFFSTTHSDDQPIKQIFISGSGCIPNTGLMQVVQAQVGVPTQQLAPITLATNKIKGDMAMFEQDANSLTTAFGLALRGLME